MSLTPVYRAPTALTSGRRWLAVSGTSLAGFIAIAGIVVVSGGSDALDRSVFTDASASRSSVATAAARVVTGFGSFPVVVAVAVLAAAGLWARTRQQAMSAILLGAVTVTAGVVYLIKVAVSRARPSTDTLIGAASLDFSFPSGHTTNAAVVYVLTAILYAATMPRRRSRALPIAIAVVLSALVGVTRVYLGYHWATDVIAGWLLATAVVATASYLSQTWTATGRELGHRRSSDLVDVNSHLHHRPW